MPSAAVERFRAWALREGPALPMVRFRTAFALVWLVYDLCDLGLLGTARIHDWMAVGAPKSLVALQVGLIACELVMLLGEPLRLVVPATVAACALRGVEWREFLRLNDFAYFAVTALIVAQARPAGGLFTPPAKGAMVPRWPRDALVAQAAWIYFATATLKMNPVWLSGQHLYVRLQYLHNISGWPLPPLLLRCADSLACDAGLAWMGVMGELSLAILLVVYPRRAVVAPLVVGIHAFGAFATNVWFFGPSLIAQVVLLTDPAYAPRWGRVPSGEIPGHSRGG